MSMSDYYAEWVERHKEEDGEGGWWITDGEDERIEGPFSEEDIDIILWDRAVSGDALSSPV